MNQLERRIRDYLCTRLDLIEPHLQLVDREFAVGGSGNLACTGSIDIMARDSFGNAVIIEIKRSDQTARTALHELSKYAALVRASIGIPIERIRLMVVSTDWRELAVPFAEFQKFCGLPLDGRVIEVLEDGTITSAKPFVPPAVGLPLSTSKTQYLRFFTSATDRADSLGTTITAAEQAGIEDYYVMSLDYHGEDSSVCFPFAFCFVFSLPPQAGDPEALRQLKMRTGWEDEDDPGQLYGIAYNLAYHDLDKQRPGEDSRDHECCYPEKLRSMRKTWSTSVAHRNGRYATNAKLYPDTDLIEDAMYMGGGTDNYLERVVSPRFGPAWNKLLADVKTVLQGNRRWSSIVPALLEEVADLYPTATVSIVLNNRKNALYGLSYLAKHGFGGYMPLLEWVVLTPDVTLHYIGELLWNGKVYTHSPYLWVAWAFGTREHFQLSQGFGSALDEDQKVRRSLGIVSTIQETQIRNGCEPIIRTIARRHKRLLRLEEVSPPYRSLGSFCRKHRKFMHALVERIGIFSTYDFSTGSTRRTL